MEEAPGPSDLPANQTVEADEVVEGAQRQGEEEEEEIVVVGYDRPKVIQWEDLQQELARLWSLSAELTRAKETKEALSQRIESIIEATKGPLLRQNELEQLRQKVETKKLMMGKLLLRSKKSTEDIRSRKEELCYDIRLLLAASNSLSTARARLQEARTLLVAEKGSHLKNLTKMLRSREQYMVTQVSMLYPVKSSASRTPKGNHDGHPNSTKSDTPSLSILGLQPVTPPLRRMSLFVDKKEFQKSASALGYVANAVRLIAAYLHLPLRYTIHFGGSRSYMHDFAPSNDPAPSDLSVNLTAAGDPKPTDFPLFLEGQDTTKAAYAIFLLNKISLEIYFLLQVQLLNSFMNFLPVNNFRFDFSEPKYTRSLVEILWNKDQEILLNYLGGESLGPRQILGNLRELIRIIRSPDYINE